jgi:hypothetical protein
MVAEMTLPAMTQHSMPMRQQKAPSFAAKNTKATRRHGIWVAF